MEMTDKEKALDRWPRAIVYRERSRKEIRRPRQIGDAPALVGYVLLSGNHWTDEDAWKDAAHRLVDF